ncbi:hypothetical protein CSUI_000947 [Cystoisospora suis]|uniref:Uncharacterized protein n=1 Tax=Cystoisospora suis TaxID=483139 RepID=A0A2C6LAI8_9APIC|nr:hypothetical protein CSUI_000947 [Cystoisospora suis]
MVSTNPKETSPHGQPEGDCLVCFESLTPENYAEYRVSEGTDGEPPQGDGSNKEDLSRRSTCWYPSKFCVDCLEELQASQFKRYCDSVANTNCAREQRSLLARGPPVNLRDRMAFPESGDQEIHSLWYAKDNAVHSARLKDSLDGEARQALWDSLRQFMIEGEELESSEQEQAKTS